MKPLYYIDINADVGEGVGNEKDLMPLLSSCNIACGGHAGNIETMNNVVTLAKQYKVKIGAHPSYPDKEHFGRRQIDISYSALFASLKQQIEVLKTVTRAQNTQLHHIKPHGALYNVAAKDKDTANVIVEVIKRFHVPLKLYVPYNSVIAKMAKAENIPIVYEVFSDRNYNNDLSLVSRAKKNALITDSEYMVNHVLNMIVNKKVKTIDGVEVHIEAETLCIHGDNPKAVLLTKKLSKKLINFGIKIQ